MSHNPHYYKFRFLNTNVAVEDDPVPYCEMWTLIECIQQILDAYEICTGGKSLFDLCFFFLHVFKYQDFLLI